MNGVEIFNPFPGLRSFEPDEAHLFFGREEQLDELLGRLRRTRFLAVVGSSGSGKSSLVRAGLIPSLYGGTMVRAGSSWRVAVCRPGDGPITNLANSLADNEVLGDPEQTSEIQGRFLEATLRRGDQGLLEAFRQARVPEDDNLLVLVDQFEELFRFKRGARRASSEEAAAFVKLLLAASRHDGVPIFVVLTMRSDFIGSCAEFSGLPEAINQGQYLIPRMTREQRRVAISGPVAVGGGEISPRLVTRLLNEVGDNPDQLPIMQHALMRTWDCWQGQRTHGEPIDLHHYEAVGTMSRALDLHAEEAFVELDDEALRACAERLFQCLTEKDEEGKGVRRPTGLAEIGAITGFAIDQVRTVIESFRRPGRSFLMPPAGVELGDDTMIDISHESLMRVWSRLRQWVDEEAESAQQYLRIAAAAQAFQAGQIGLWRDPELQLALQWREHARPTEAWARRYDPSFPRAMVLLDQSRDARTREIQRKDRLQRRQLIRARALLAVMCVAAFLILLFGINAWTAKQEAVLRAIEAEQARRAADTERVRTEEQRQRAEHERQVSDGLRVEAEAARSSAEQSERQAVAERHEAERQRTLAIAEKRLAEQARRQEAEARQLEEQSRHDAEQASQRAESERLRAEHNLALAEISEAEALRLRSLELAKGLAARAQHLLGAGEAELAALAALQAYRFHTANDGLPHDPAILTALRASLSELGAGVDAELGGRRSGQRATAWSPDGAMIAIGGEDGAIELLRIDGSSLRPDQTLDLGDAVRSLAMSRSLLAAASATGHLGVWSLESSHTRPVAAPALASPVTAVACSPASGDLAVTTADGGLYLWNPNGSGFTVLLEEPEVRLTSAAFDPSGARLAVGGADGAVRLCAVDRTGATHTLSGMAAVRSIAFSPDGRHLAAGQQDGVIVLWDLGSEPASAERLGGHLSSVNGLGFTADAQLLVSASSDGTLRVWRTANTGGVPAVLTGHGSWVWDVALSPDGRRACSVSADRTARVWSLRSDDLAARVCPLVGRSMTREEWIELVAADVEYEPTCAGGTNDGE